MDPKWLDLLLGPAGLLVFVLLTLETGRRGIWVWGREKDEAHRERDAWKAEAHAVLEAARERMSGRMG